MQTADVEALGIAKAARTRRIIRALGWVGSVWLIGWTGTCVEQAVAWTDGVDFLEVITDATHTHVHVIYGTI